MKQKKHLIRNSGLDVIQFFMGFLFEIQVNMKKDCIFVAAI